MNLGDCYAEIGRLLNDPNNDRWSQTVLLKRINQCQKEVQAYTNLRKIQETLTPTANDDDVQLNVKTIDVLRVVITRANGDLVPLKGTTKEELDFYSPNWMNEDPGTPRTWWFESGDVLLHLVPAPDTSNAITNGLFVLETRYPADLADVTGGSLFDDQGSTTPYHMAVVHYVVALCFMDDATPEALAKSKFHKSGDMERPGQFELIVKNMQKRFDAPSDVETRIHWKPQGGRVNSWSQRSKSTPLGSW